MAHAHFIPLNGGRKNCILRAICPAVLKRDHGVQKEQIVTVLQPSGHLSTQRVFWFVIIRGHLSLTIISNIIVYLQIVEPVG